MKKLITLLVIFLIIFFTGFVSGYSIAKNNIKKETVSIQTDIILSALQDQGFLISQSYLFNESVTIEKSTGSAFKDLFFGQDIQAIGNVKVSSGVDLSKVGESDIVVTGDAIEIAVPEVSTFSVEVIGDVQVTNKQGVLKKILDNEDGYNESVELLKDKAREVAARVDIRKEAEENAIDEISRLVGYIDGGKIIVVKIGE